MTGENNSISAVCRGATLWGLEQSNVTSFISRMARISYGIQYCVPWDPNNPNMKATDKFYDAAKGRWLARGQMTWLLNRVRLVAHSHPFLVSLTDSYQIRARKSSKADSSKEELSTPSISNQVTPETGNPPKISTTATQMSHRRGKMTHE